MGDGAQVGVLRAGGIGAGALEQHELTAAGLTGSGHRIIEFTQRRHIAGDDQGLSGRCGLFDQGQVIVLEAGDLKSWHIQLQKEDDCRLIKRGTEADQAQIQGPFHDRGLPLLGGV